MLTACFSNTPQPFNGYFLRFKRLLDDFLELSVANIDAVVSQMTCTSTKSRARDAAGLFRCTINP